MKKCFLKLSRYDEKHQETNKKLRIIYWDMSMRKLMFLFDSLIKLSVRSFPAIVTLDFCDS